jgi:molybdate transport repressor ModE-like protein
VVDQLQAVPGPVEQSRAAAERAVDPARSRRPRLTAVGAGEALQQVQMENIHPLRLRLLLEIDRAGSISAAAERCAIGQPSASMHLRTLETALGQRLVIRNGRGSRLTPAGRIVASHAARMLAILDRMRWALDALNAPSTGELTLAASITPSLVLIPPILGEFSDRYPGVSVNVRTMPSEMVIREVSRGEADVGIAGEVACEGPVVRQELLVDELVGIAAAGSNIELMTRTEFARSNLLLGADGSSTRMVIERRLAHADYRPARIWAFDSCEAIKRAVVDGLGLSFMSRLLVEKELERRELAIFRILGVERIVRPILAVQPSFAELTPHAAEFMTLLIDAYRTPFLGGAAAVASQSSEEFASK